VGRFCKIHDMRVFPEFLEGYFEERSHPYDFYRECKNR